MDNWLGEQELALIEEEVLRSRRRIHQNPDLSLEEFETAAYVVERLKSYGFTEIYTGIGVTGVIGIMRGDSDESILLRADMDALPINESNELPFKSCKPNVMHACGHDAHTSMLLGAALATQMLVKAGLKLKRGIKYCFQPAEEDRDGAKKMVTDTINYDTLEGSPKVKYCFGMHVTPQYPCHQVLYSPGPVQAACDFFEINVSAEGTSSDAILPASQLIMAINQIKSRNVDQTRPSTVSVGMFVARPNGSGPCSSAQITGTIRSLYRQDRDIIVDRINKLCRGAEIQQDCKVDFNITLSTDEVLNHPALEPFIRSALGPVLPYKFDLGAEDFCEFSTRRPSTYIFLGSALEGSITTGTNTIYPYHSPLFRIDERCMMTGVRTWLQLIAEWQRL